MERPDVTCFSAGKNRRGNGVFMRIHEVEPLDHLADLDDPA